MLRALRVEDLAATPSCRGVRGKRRGKGAKFRGNKATIWLRMSNLTQKWPENKANLSVPLGHGQRSSPLQPKNKANWFNHCREGMAFGAIIAPMGSPPSTYRAHRCSFRPDRVDPYLRLSTVTVFVRDQDSSLRFYLDQLGFCLAFNVPLPSGDRWLAVAPPDGTAMLALVAPKPDSEEYKLIGRSTQIDFLTEDVFAKFEEWRQRGVRFEHPPEMQSWGATSTSFEDVDGNSFTLLCFDEMTWEVEAQRRAHVERMESERRAAQELEIARQAQARL